MACGGVALALRATHTSIDQSVAETWGVVMVRSQKGGLALGSIDAFVAATAVEYGLILVTRNIKDFNAQLFCCLIRGRRVRSQLATPCCGRAAICRVRRETGVRGRISPLNRH